MGRPHLCTPPLTCQAWPLPAPFSGTMTCLIHSHALHRPTPPQIMPAAPRKSQACATSQWSQHPPLPPTLGTVQDSYPILNSIEMGPGGERISSLP